MNARQFAGYGFLALTWGASFLVLLRVVEAFGWVGAVSFRCFVASGTLLLVARLAGQTLDFYGRWRHFAVVGATTVAVQLLGLSYATPLIGTAMAAILVATIPLFSMLIAHAWGLETIRLQAAFGLALGFLGLMLLVGFPSEPITPAFIAGCAGSLISAFAAAFGSNYASRFLGDASARAVTTAAFLLGGVMTLPLLPLVPVPGVPEWRDYMLLLIAGALMSALTYVVYFWLVAEIGATRTISVEFAVTLVAVIIGAFYLHEPITLMQIAGGVIIVLGCALVLGLWPKGRARRDQD